MKRWWAERNTRSLEGLPGLVSAPASDQVFRPTVNTPVHPDQWDTKGTKRSYFKELPDTLGAIDLKLIVAFLLGMLLASVYGRIVLTARQFLMSVHTLS
jgi:hypothetical protein